MFSSFSRDTLRMIRNFATPGPSAADVRVVLIVVSAHRSAFCGRNPKVGRTSIEHYGNSLWGSSNANRTVIYVLHIFLRQVTEGHITTSVFAIYIYTMFTGEFGFLKRNSEKKNDFKILTRSKNDLEEYNMHKRSQIDTIS